MEAVETRELEALLGDIAEQCMTSRFRVERSELVGKVLERLVLGVLERDPRFYGSAKGSLWELAAQREENEAARRAKEERDAEQASLGEWRGPEATLRPLGTPFGNAA